MLWLKGVRPGPLGVTQDTPGTWPSGEDSVPGARGWRAAVLSSGTRNLVQTVTWAKGTGESVHCAQEQSLTYEHVAFPGSKGGCLISIYLCRVLWILISPSI